MPSIRFTYNDRAKIILVQNEGGAIRLSSSSSSSSTAGVISFNTRVGVVTLLLSDITDILDVEEETRPKIQTLVEQSTILFDYSIASFGLLNTLSQNRNISFSNLKSPSFVLLKIKHTVAGKVINLPGRKEVGFAWATGLNDTTILYGIWDSAEWVWDSQTVLAPIMVNSMITASPTTISVVLNRSVTSTGTGWSFKKNGSPLSSSGVSGSGTNTLVFTVGSMISGDVLSASYDSNAGDTQDASGNLASFTDASVTNNLSAGDTDANNWIAQLGANGASQDGTHQTYIQTFIAGLKSDGLWTKIYALYVPIFGSANANKWNIKNSVDSNAAFRLTFTAGWTFGSNGSTSNGSSAFADTHFSPSVNATQNSLGFGGYYRAGSGSNFNQIGEFSGTDGAYLQLSTINLNGNVNSSTNTPAAITPTRLCYIRRNSASNVNKYRDGVNIQTDNTASNPPNNLSIYFGALNNGATPTFWGDAPVSLWIITDGTITDADVTALNNRVNTFMTSWGINV